MRSLTVIGKRTQAFLLVLASLGTAFADSSETAPFLVYPVGARAVGVGDAVAAYSDDAAALFSNPAGLSRLAPFSAVLGHAPYLDTAAHDHWAVSYNSGTRGALGVGMSFFSVGRVDTMDRSGFPLASASPSDWQGIVGYGKTLAGPAWVNGHSVGASLKYVSSTLVQTADTYSGDIGVLSPRYWKGRWGWGLAVNNVGGSLTYYKESEPLPRLVRWGMVWRPIPSLAVLSDIDWLKGDSAFLALGSEYHKSFRKQRGLTFRAGYNGRQGEVAAGDGVNLGMGFFWSSWRIDYSYRGLTLQEPTQSLSLSISFKPKGRVLSPPLQALVDEGNRLIEAGQYPESVLVFDQALDLSPDCREALAGMERANSLMSGR
ncbi:MAG: PorV/PorQ family protein [Elusimicrobia bacterium]|nr:PorV/PorQ family protein [Elusimicrobiota bacterium]